MGPLSRELLAVDVVSTTNDVVGEIISVLNINKYHACCVCAEKLYLTVKHCTVKNAR